MAEAQANQAHDVLELDWETFRTLADQDILFCTPLIIKEAFADSNEYSCSAYADLIESSFPKGLINVETLYKSPCATRTSMVACMIRSAKHIPDGPNLLDLQNISNAIRPGSTRLRRFRLLDFINHELRAEFTEKAGKQTVLTPFDVDSSQSFESFGFQGAFSGAHLDGLGGTWLRNLFGTKLYMVVPQSNMTEDDWMSFSQDSPVWDPKGKARAIILRPGDVFFMPPSIKVVHAVLTLEACLMSGGMLWDELTILPTLHGLLWVCKNQATTNEPMPYQLRAALDGLERRLLTLTSDADITEIQKAISNLRGLGCQCQSNCGTECPCYIGERRCTPLGR